MGSPLRQDRRRARPLVALLWSIPLLAEALGGAIEFAELVAFPEQGSDIGGLLASLRPDLLIVDAASAAEAAMPYAREHDLPVLHISLQDNELLLLRAGAWERAGGEDGAAPEAVRNVVAGALYARDGAR
jgi:hypothetical protein